MPNAVIIGASGYAGAVLAELVAHHPEFSLAGLYVSENSLDAGKKLSELYPHLLGTVDDVLKPLTPENPPRRIRQTQYSSALRTR